MKPWRAADTNATASGKRIRIASRSAIACSSDVPVASIRCRAAPVSSTAVLSVKVANCSRCASATDSACCAANSRSPRIRSSGSPPNGKLKPSSPISDILPHKRGAGPRGPARRNVLFAELVNRVGPVDVHVLDVAAYLDRVVILASRHLYDTRNRPRPGVAGVVVSRRPGLGRVRPASLQVDGDLRPNEARFVLPLELVVVALVRVRAVRAGGVRSRVREVVHARVEVRARGVLVVKPEVVGDLLAGDVRPLVRVVVRGRVEV